MTKPIEYKPSPFRIYFQLIMFCSSLTLTFVNIGLYHFWKYSDIYLLITNVINIVGFFIIVIIQIVRSTFINHIKSLFLTWDIHHKLIIPKQISDFTTKPKSSPTNDIYNSYLRQTYGEFVHNNLYICVRIPNNIEVAKLLDDKLIKLRESIVNQYPKYSFTGFERKGVYLISVGTK